MSPPSRPALAVAKRLWARMPGEAATAAAATASAEQLCMQLRVGLARWIGGEGYRALFRRAFDMARVDHPALDSLSWKGRMS